MKKNNTQKRYWIIVLIIFLCAFSLVLLNKEKKDKTSNELSNKAIKVLKWSSTEKDGTVDVTNRIQKMLDSTHDKGSVIFPAGRYLVNGKVSVKNKSINIYSQGEVQFIGTGEIHFNSDMSSSVPSNNIKKESNILNCYLNVNINDYIEISGDIVHRDYNPSRYKTLKFIAKVVSNNNGKIKLDRHIQYGLNNVKIAKISNPYQIHIDKGFKFNGVGLYVNHFVGGEINAAFTGVRGTGSGLFINQSIDFTVNVNINDLVGTMGIVLNDCNNFKAFVNATRVGLMDGTGTKAFRGNGLQNGYIDLICNSSIVGDSTIYGSRNLEVKIRSKNGGRYFRRIHDTSGNRLETVQFSESDNLKVIAYMDNVDDQALEFLSVEDSNIYPQRINTLEGSTEGALVIKGSSKNIIIHHPVIRCYNDYGIKIETLEGAHNIKIINPDIVNLENGRTGITVRDSKITHNVNLEVKNGYIKASVPFLIYNNNNYVSLKNMVVQTTGGHAISGYSDFLNVYNVNIIGGNDLLTRAVVSSGSHDTISKVNSKGAIYVRNQDRRNLDIKRYEGNKVSRIYIDASS
ncbi:hypothetical protein [Neobacillus cucumis]|uniref:hypothetical protein n=1 Tax=Neobacillus cucumis TaxID=1740721 RepID=UPI001962C4F1|nr:hypothetical protein [Neobacillus cucumis]MBM7652537.1 hypothetical protein [Neobacillus cucumis]